MSRRRKRQWGATLVEFALCAGLLALIFFGLIEMGLLLGDQALLDAAARQAARALAVGNTPAVAANGAVAVFGPALTSADVQLQRSTPSAAGAPTAWVTVGTSGTNNDASTGDFVRATLTYSHPLITSLVFTGGTKTLTSALVMRRE